MSALPNPLTLMQDAYNIMSVDLEEWFVVEALRSRYPQEKWHELPSTLVRNCLKLLDLFDEKKVKATWFSLGWCVDQNPDIMAEIAHRGHEIACHSYWHRRVDSMNSDQFRKDTERACEAIERATGQHPRGYRAPSWSINDRVSWAFDVLAELGFLYDSSIFPIKHDIYGMPTGPRRFFKMQCADDRTLYELPASTYRVLGRNMPVSGGGYLRHQPYWYSRKLIQRINDKDMPAVVYVHPWEIDDDPPKVADLSPVQWFRTYGSTDIMAYKLDRLLTDFRFTTVEWYLRERTRRPIGFHQS